MGQLFLGDQWFWHRKNLCRKVVVLPGGGANEKWSRVVSRYLTVQESIRWPDRLRSASVCLALW